MNLAKDTRPHAGETDTLFESRTARFNLPVRNRGRWRVIRELLLSPPTHLAHYRELRARLFLHAADAESRRECRP